MIRPEGQRTMIIVASQGPGIATNSMESAGHRTLNENRSNIMRAVAQIYGRQGTRWHGFP